MRTECFEVDLPHSEAELRAIFVQAHAEDVEKGGRYDARSAAINIWSHTWHNEGIWAESETIGTFYFHWADKHRLYLIECNEGFDCDDMLHVLAELETKALGHIKHGRFHNEL